MKCANCERPALFRPKHRTTVKTDKNHDLCERCFRDELNRTRPERDPIRRPRVSNYQDAKTVTRTEMIRVPMVRCDYCSATRDGTYDINSNSDPLSPGWGRTLLYGDREPCDVCPACVARMGLKANA